MRANASLLPTGTRSVIAVAAGRVADRVYPDFGAVGGSGRLRQIVGALLTYGLVIAVLMVIICAATWALTASSGSWHTAAKAKTGLFVALGGAALTGGALAWANWLIDLGATL